MKEKLLARKKELDKEFRRLSAERDFCIEKSNNNYSEMIKLKGAYEEIDKLLKEIK